MWLRVQRAAVLVGTGATAAALVATGATAAVLVGTGETAAALVGTGATAAALVGTVGTGSGTCGYGWNRQRHLWVRLPSGTVPEQRSKSVVDCQHVSPHCARRINRR
ncbi:hypothetical protein EBB07_34565 [Paenibacillaceae bacterium]|nr:hypothetical protein EBB07_34565 [Paenibacillaceae bacterium]